jgi:hypothetical protein
MNDGMNQQALRIDKNMPLLTLDLLSRVVARRINRSPPFSALLTPWLSMTEAGDWLPANRFAALYIELMMYEIERAIPTPRAEIIVRRRARRQVFRDRPPLTTGGENIDEAVTISRMITVRLSPPRLQRFDQFPFVVAEVARIADGCRASHRTVMTNRRVPAIWAMPASDWHGVSQDMWPLPTLLANAWLPNRAPSFQPLDEIRRHAPGAPPQTD